jgi:hypothetical protein
MMFRNKTPSVLASRDANMLNDSLSSSRDGKDGADNKKGNWAACNKQMTTLLKVKFEGKSKSLRGHIKDCSN